MSIYKTLLSTDTTAEHNIGLWEELKTKYPEMPDTEIELELLKEVEKQKEELKEKYFTEKRVITVILGRYGNTENLFVQNIPLANVLKSLLQQTEHFSVDVCNEIGKEAVYTISTGPTGDRCYAEYRMLDSSKFPPNTTTQEILDKLKGLDNVEYLHEEIGKYTKSIWFELGLPHKEVQATEKKAKSEISILPLDEHGISEMLQAKYTHFYRIVKKFSKRKDKKPKICSFDVKNLITGEIKNMTRNEVVALLSNGNGVFFTNLKLNGPNNIGGKKHSDYNEVEIIFINQ